MTDRELLELAAKAAGIEIATWSNAQAGGFLKLGVAEGRFWNPLTDDGDALRLAVKLGISLPTRLGNQCYACSSATFKEVSDDIYAATRRAIVRAAAEIGRAK